MAENDGFGVRLAKARGHRRIKQDELAQLLGTHRQTVSKWERGKHAPDAATVAAIAAALSVTADYLLGRTDSHGVSTALREFLGSELGQLAQQHRYLPTLLSITPPNDLELTPDLYAAMTAALLSYEFRLIRGK